MMMIHNIDPVALCTMYIPPPASHRRHLWPSISSLEWILDEAPWKWIRYGWISLGGVRYSIEKKRLKRYQSGAERRAKFYFFTRSENTAKASYRLMMFKWWSLQSPMRMHMTIMMMMTRMMMRRRRMRRTNVVSANPLISTLASQSLTKPSDAGALNAPRDLRPHHPHHPHHRYYPRHHTNTLTQAKFSSPKLASI